jgi:putative CocE/NonD family hydrolase
MQFLLDKYLDDQFTEFPYNLKQRLSEVSIPSLNIAGWNDIFLQDTIDSFTSQQEQGNPSKLLIGPWAHLNFSGTIGEVDYGMAGSMSFINKEYDHVALLQKWFDRWLKDEENGIDKEPPVKYFIGGENTWHTDSQWPPTGVKPTPYYFHEKNHLSPEKPSQEGSKVSYSYDPRDPVPTHGGAVLMHPYFISGPRNQQLINKRDDLLVFSTQELGKDLRLVGPVKVNLWASTSGVDTDFVATLLDICPDNKALNITDGIIRAKYCNGNEPVFLSPGEVYAFTIDLWSVGYTFKQGHKMALRITSSNFPRWDRNLNNGGASFEPVVAEQTIYLDAEYPSRIILPISSIS